MTISTRILRSKKESMFAVRTAKKMETTNRISRRKFMSRWYKTDEEKRGYDALERFLGNHGEEFLSWRDGCIVVETYYDKKFRALGGDTNRLISFFEDYCTMPDASRRYIAALRASNVRAKRGQTAPQE